MLVIPGVLLANRKPANAMHKVQRTRRILILMRVTPDYEQVSEIPFHIYRTEGQLVNRVKMVLLSRKAPRCKTKHH